MAVIEEAIVALIKSQSPAIAGGRIYPVVAPQNATYPLITFEKISGERVRALEGPLGRARPRIRFHCWAEKYADAKTLANQVRRLLDGFAGTVSGVQIDSSTLDSEQDLYEDQVDTHQIVLDFFISHLET